VTCVVSLIHGVCRKAGSLFDAEDDIEEFLEVRGLDNLKAEFFVYANRLVEAAQAFLEVGEPLRAADVLISTNEDDHHAQAQTLVLEELWKFVPIQACSPLDPTILNQVLELASRLPMGDEGSEVRHSFDPQWLLTLVSVGCPHESQFNDTCCTGERFQKSKKP
jgi:hypothetical protein